jgi:hypothetical protein
MTTLSDTAWRTAALAFGLSIFSTSGVVAEDTLPISRVNQQIQRDVEPQPRPAELQDPQPFSDDDTPLLGSEISGAEARQIDRELLANILEIHEPAERALALIRAARYKAILGDFPVTTRALDQAAISARQVTDPLTRDLRLIGVAEGYTRLGDELVDEASADRSFNETFEGAKPTSPEAQLEHVRQALSAYDNASQLAVLIERPTYNAEAIYRIVDRAAASALKYGSYANKQRKLAELTEEIVSEMESLADQLFVQGVKHAQLIKRPGWRDRALVAVAAAAGSSRNFDRAFEIAGIIPYPEVRAEGFLRIAESAARRGTEEETTRAYSSAARTIASIPIEDLRATLANVLVDSLISSGRFVDARRCVVLYPDDQRKIIALGAVAQSMGARGLSDEAREWIEREVNPAYHARLLRQVNDGVLNVLQRFRPETFSGGPVR